MGNYCSYESSNGRKLRRRVMSKIYIILVMIIAPYFFYWITPDTPQGQTSVLALINTIMCVSLEVICFYLLVDKDFYKLIFKGEE